jgi:hypothetical protein
MMTSSGVMVPRSPWLASVGWTNMAGVPVDARVAAILRAIWPLLPTPDRMTRPVALRSTSMAATKLVPRPSSSATSMVSRPWRSLSIVRLADARKALDCSWASAAVRGTATVDLAVTTACCSRSSMIFSPASRLPVLIANAPPARRLGCR